MKSNPFPAEALFPGLHAARPDIAEREARQFLAFGSRPGGFDVSDPARLSELLGSVPFVRFQVRPLPVAIAARLAALPDDWERDCEAEAIAIEAAVEQHYAIPESFRATIMEEREVWISKRLPEE